MAGEDKLPLLPGVFIVRGAVTPLAVTAGVHPCHPVCELSQLVVIHYPTIIGLSTILNTIITKYLTDVYLNNTSYKLLLPFRLYFYFKLWSLVQTTYGFI